MTDMAGRVSSPTFIGRSEELRRLQDAARRARTGQPSLVLVGGDAGIGKTRLLEEFRGRTEDALVMVGGCLEIGDGTLPFAPIVEALRGLVREVGQDAVRAELGPARRELGRLLPSLSTAVSGDVTADPHGGNARAPLFEAILDALGRLSRNRPLILAIEDIHWADRSTLDLLTFLARNLTSERLVVVATYRIDELHRRHVLRPVLAELSRLAEVDRLELSPFAPTEIIAQLTAIMGVPPDAQLVQDVLERSEGNAFYAEELLAAGRDGDGFRLPPTLRDILSARLADVPPETARVLRAAAAAGRHVEHDLLAQVSELDEDALVQALREAISRELLVATGHGYRFRHALLQEAAYEELLPGERTALHATIARALEAAPGLACGGEEAAHGELAHHWYEARDLGRSFTTSLLAGGDAMRMYAFTEALHHYERALELYDQIPDEARREAPPRWRILRHAADAALASGEADLRRALAHQRAAVDALDPDVPAEARAHLHSQVSRTLWILGEGEAAQEESEQALVLLPDAPSAERARVLGWHGRMLMLNGRHHEAMAPSQEAVEVARAAGARIEEAHALNSLGTALGLAGQVEAGLEALRTSLDIAHETGSGDEILRGYVNLMSVLDLADRADEANEAGYAAMAWCQERGLSLQANPFVPLNTVSGLIRTGQWRESRELLSQLMLAGRRDVSGIFFHSESGQLALRQGRFDEARHHLGELDSLLATVIDPQFLIPYHVAAADLAVWEGRHDDARPAAREAMQIRTDGAPWFDQLIEVGARGEADRAIAARQAGDADEVAEAIAHIEDLIAIGVEVVETNAVFPGRLGVARASLAAAEAHLGRAKDGSDPAAWEVAVGTAVESGDLYLELLARWRHAESLLPDERAAAEETLTVAVRSARQEGSQAILEELLSLARRGRISLPGMTDEEDGGLGLTPREQEVLALVADGLTNREIGERLFVTEKTAETHVSNILRKLDVTNRVEAAAIAHRSRT